MDNDKITKESIYMCVCKHWDLVRKICMFRRISIEEFARPNVKSVKNRTAKFHKHTHKFAHKKRCDCLETGDDEKRQRPTSDRSV